MFDNPTAIDYNISFRLGSSGESDGRSLKVNDNNNITDSSRKNTINGTDSIPTNIPIEALSADQRTADALSTDQRTTDALYTDQRTTDALSTDQRTTEALSTDQRTRDALSTDQRTRDALSAMSHSNLSSDTSGLVTAMKSPEAAQWQKTIDAEYRTLQEEKTWLPIPKLPYWKFWVPSHMVLVKQRLADGSIKKYKARLVANGSKQHLNTYNKISSPTASESSIKLFYVCIAA